MPHPSAFTPPPPCLPPSACIPLPLHSPPLPATPCLHPFTLTLSAFTPLHLPPSITLPLPSSFTPLPPTPSLPPSTFTPLPYLPPPPPPLCLSPTALEPLCLDPSAFNPAPRAMHIHFRRKVTLHTSKHCLMLHMLAAQHTLRAGLSHKPTYERLLARQLLSLHSLPPPPPLSPCKRVMPALF